MVLEFKQSLSNNNSNEQMQGQINREKPNKQIANFVSCTNPVITITKGQAYKPYMQITTYVSH